MKLPLAVWISAVALCHGAGCASRSYAPLDANIESMRSVRSALEEANAQVDLVLASLNKVVAWADRDPRPALDEFEDEFAKLEDLAVDSSDRTQAMTEASEQYFQSWHAENADMKTADLQDLSAERMSVARESWRNVQDRAVEMNEAFQVCLGKFRELKGYLGNNLSPSGIQASRTFVESAEKSGRTLKDRIAGTVRALDEMTAKVAPAGSEP